MNALGASALGTSLEDPLAVLSVVVLAVAVQLPVPFVPQEKDTCGAAALAMVMRYWGAEASHDVIATALVDAEVRGIQGSRLADFAREQGMTAIAFAADRGVLRDHLAKGRPLIVAIDAGRDRLHDVVVVGLDEAGGQVVVHDPARGPGRRLALSELRAPVGEERALGPPRAAARRGGPRGRTARHGRTRRGTPADAVPERATATSRGTERAEVNPARSARVPSPRRQPRATRPWWRAALAAGRAREYAGGRRRARPGDRPRARAARGLDRAGRGAVPGGPLRGRRRRPAPLAGAAGRRVRPRPPGLGAAPRRARARGPGRVEHPRAADPAGRSRWAAFARPTTAWPGGRSASGRATRSRWPRCAPRGGAWRRPASSSGSRCGRSRAATGRPCWTWPSPSGTASRAGRWTSWSPPGSTSPGSGCGCATATSAAAGSASERSHRWQENRPETALQVQWPRPLSLPATLRLAGFRGEQAYDLGGAFDMRRRGIDLVLRHVLGGGSGGRPRPAAAGPRLLRRARGRAAGPPGRSRGQPRDAARRDAPPPPRRDGTAVRGRPRPRLGRRLTCRPTPSCATRGCSRRRKGAASSARCSPCAPVAGGGARASRSTRCTRRASARSPTCRCARTR